MKTKNLLYLAGAVLIAYYIFRKKTPAATPPKILQAASDTASEILTTIPEIKEAPARELVFLPSPPQRLPISVTQSELVTEPQLSPTPASVLSPEQLIKFNTAAAKGQLMGVC